MGYENYLHHLIPRLARHTKVSRLLVGMPVKNNIVEWQEKYDFIEWISLETSLFNWRYIGKGANRQVKQFDPDVVFIPTSRSWKKHDVAIVNMVRNMEPLAYDGDNPFSESIRNWLRAKEAYKSVREADRVIAVSKFVKDFMIQRWNLDPERIGVVYHGVEIPDNSNFLKPENIPESWAGKFIFAAGSIRSARGLEDAIYAMSKMPKEKIGRFNLVIAGNTNQHMEQYCRKLNITIEQSGLTSNVIWTGKLSKQEINWCYQNCYMFLMVSRIEACPNTALEAMAHSCLCISSYNPPLPEIFADAAIYYVPKRPEILAQRICEVSNWSDNERYERKKRALARASDFCWDKCVEQTVLEIEKAIKTFRNE